MDAQTLPVAIAKFLADVTATVRTTEGAETKWKDLGVSCRAVFVTVQEFDKYTNQVRDAVKAGLKASDQKALNGNVKDMSPEEKEERNNAGTKVTVYYGRVRKYGFPPVPVVTPAVVDPVKAAHDEAAKKAAQAALEKAEAAAAESIAKAEKRQAEESLKLAELVLKSDVERKDKKAAAATRRRVADLKRKVETVATKVAETEEDAKAKAEAAKAAQIEANAKLALIEIQKQRDNLKSKLVDALKIARESKLENAPDLVKALQAAHDLLISAK
jgi:hypothetical protein